MRVLKTEDCFYVAGGEEGGGNTDSGAANDSGNSGGNYGGNNPTGDDGVSCTRAGVEAYAACQQNNGEQLAGLFGQITSRGGMLAEGDKAYRGWCHDNRDSGGR